MPPSSSPNAEATAARARLAVADGEARHGARGSAGSAERERDRDGAVRHRVDDARSSSAAAGAAPRAARSSSEAAGGCGARRGWGRHLTVQVTDGGMARGRLGARGSKRTETGWLAGESGGRETEEEEEAWEEIVWEVGLSSVSRVVARL